MRFLSFANASVRCYNTSYIQFILSDLAERNVVHTFRFNTICCLTHLVLGLLILPFDDLKARIFAPLLAVIFCGLRKAIAPCLCCQNLRKSFEKWLDEEELTVAEREEGNMEMAVDAVREKVMMEMEELFERHRKYGVRSMEENAEMAVDAYREEGKMEMVVDAGNVLEGDEISDGRIELTGDLVEELMEC